MSADSQSPSPKTWLSRRAHLTIIIGSFSVLLAITAILICAPGPDPTLQWLAPQAISPGTLGKLEQLMASIKNVTAPIWRPFSRKPRPIAIRSSLIRILPRDLALADFGPPISTNSTGVRAWVLDPDKLRAFVPPLSAIHDSSQSVMMFDGGRASLAAGSSLGGSYSNASLTTIQLSYAPKIVSEGIRLDVGVTLSSAIPGGTDLASIRARIPTAGALLLDFPAATAGDGRHYLYFFTPTIPQPSTTLTTGGSAFRPARTYTTTPPHSQW